MQKLFLSRDLESTEIQAFEKLYHENGAMFLDEQVEIPHICFASLMRSGNTFYRRLIEQISGLVSGSNIMTQTSLCLSFVIQGFKGESVLNNRTWIVKSHFPYVYPFTMPCNINQAIVLVRNPFDVIVSLFQFSLNATQSRNVANDFPTEFKTEWEGFVKFAVKVWNTFYKFYLD